MNLLSVVPADVPAAQGLTREDFKRIQDFLDHSVSENTRAMYRSAWKTFDEWTSARAVSGPAGIARPGGRLLVPPGRGAKAVGGHRPSPQGCPGGHPPGHRPRGPHRQRGSAEGPAGDLAGPTEEFRGRPGP